MKINTNKIMDNLLKDLNNIKKNNFDLNININDFNNFIDLFYIEFVETKN
jgi:hypothetical protein